MKRLTLFLVISLLCSFGFYGQATAQIPRQISYQGLLADPSGTFIPDGNHTLILNLYDNAGSSTPIFSETQTVPVVRGLFNVLIGSASPIPTSVTFDRAYFLGVVVDAGPELSPRTPLTSAPYALYADMAGQAKSLTPGATGVVTSVNGADGAITLQGAGGTAVTTNGNVITIASSGGSGGTGIQGVQNTDGALTVVNPTGPIATLNVAAGGINAGMLAPNSVGATAIQDGSIGLNELAFTLPANLPPSGPAGGDLTGNYPNPTIGNDKVTSAKILDGGVATIDLADGSVTTPKLANGSVTVAKINSDSTATTGLVLTATPSGMGWRTPSSGLVLPYAGVSNTVGSTAMLVSNNTTGGGGGWFRITNTTNIAIGLTGSTLGMGRAGVFSISNSTNRSEALNANTDGSGPAFLAAQNGTGTTIATFQKSNTDKAFIDSNGAYRRIYNGTFANGTPIAYGYCSGGTTPTLSGNTANASVAWNGTNSYYEITITGESVTQTGYVMVATPTYVASTAPLMHVQTGAVNNKMIVACKNLTGAASAVVTSPFYFVVYRP